MSLSNRLQGVFFAPESTLKAVSERPIWTDALVVLLILIALFSYITGPYSQKDTLQTLKNNAGLRERMGEERYNQMIERLENPSKVGVVVRSFLVNPVLILVGFLFSSLILLGMGRLTSTQGNYVQVFSVYLHANFIDKILGKAVQLVLILMRKSVAQTTTSLALIFPRLEVASASYIILSQVDFFQLWLFGILGYGLSHIFKIKMKKALFISYGFWLIKSLLYIAIGLFGLQYMK